MNILQMSVTAGVLILMIIAIRVLAINRLPKKMFIILWVIALCRLLIPFSFPWKIGISALINRISLLFMQKPEIVSRSLNTGGMSFQNAGYISIINAPFQVGPQIIMVWAVGAALLGLFFAVSFYKCYSEIRTALPIKGNAAIDKWMSKQKIKRTLGILVSDKISTPLTYGVIKPKIILPKSMDLSDEPQLEYILAHESIHIKRFDALWKLVPIIALCCHWFNPLVWILYILLNRDLEITCDEKVIRLFGESTKSDYALSLIKMAEHRTKFTPLYSSFSKNATEERILSIMKFKKTSLTGIALALVLVAGAMSVFADSTLITVHRFNGVIQTENGRFSFEFDDKGIITVKDTEGKVVSTAKVDSDGNATLTDGNGKVIQKMRLDILGAASGQKVSKIKVVGISAEEDMLLPGLPEIINN